jgi:hypothetical protein
LRAVAWATTTLDQVMAIEHRMDGALGRDFDARESAEETLADLAGAPAGMLVLHIQDVVLHLEGKLMRVAIGTPAAVGEPLKAAFLVAIEDLVAGLTRNPKLSAKFRHRLAG